MTPLRWSAAAGSPLDPVDRLPGQGGLFGDLSDAHGLLPQHGAHLVELIARVAPLTAEVSPVVILLRMLDAGSLCSLGGLSLCRSSGGR